MYISTHRYMPMQEQIYVRLQPRKFGLSAISELYLLFYKPQVKKLVHKSKTY